MPAPQFDPSTHYKFTQEGRWSEIPWWQWPKEMSLGFSYSDFPGLSWVLSLFETGLVHSLKWKKTKSCLTCNPKNCSPPGSSVHGILQARILEWVAISFSRGTSQPRNWTLQADALPTELLRKPWRKISILKMNAFTISKLDFQKKREYCGLGLSQAKCHETDSGLGWRSSSPWCMKGQQLLIINQLHQVALVIKNSPAKAGDIRAAGLTPVLGRSPGRRHGNPL